MCWGTRTTVARSDVCSSPSLSQQTEWPVASLTYPWFHCNKSTVWRQSDNDQYNKQAYFNRDTTFPPPLSPSISPSLSLPSSPPFPSLPRLPSSCPHSLTHAALSAHLLLKLRECQAHSILTEHHHVPVGSLLYLFLQQLSNCGSKQWMLTARAFIAHTVTGCPPHQTSRMSLSCKIRILLTPIAARQYNVMQRSATKWVKHQNVYEMGSVATLTISTFGLEWTFTAQFTAHFIHIPWSHVGNARELSSPA